MAKKYTRPETSLFDASADDDEPESTDDEQERSCVNDDDPADRERS